MERWSDEALAADVYTLARIEAAPAKKWGSAILAWATALTTLGGGATPIVGPGVRILDRDGSVLAEIGDEMWTDGAVFEQAQHDLATMSADEFAARWITRSAS